MRIIEVMMAAAVNTAQNFKQANTAVTVDGTVIEVRLHDNLIYARSGDFESFTLHGWKTKTTLSRLRALSLGIFITKGVMRIDGLAFTAADILTFKPGIGWQITGKLESGQTAVTDDNGLIVSK